jgi:arylformamidase
MKIYDISIPLQSGMPVWPGDDNPEFEQYTTIDNGYIVNSTRIYSSAHIGTHVDAPRHLFNEGRTIDEIPLKVLIGSTMVVDLNDANQINRHVLSSNKWQNSSRILFKTLNSKYWKSSQSQFKQDFVSLTPDGAEFLLEKKIQLVGIDYLSIDLFNADQLPVHKILLKNDVVIIEGLNLAEVPEGLYELICLPIKILGSDGAPARAILKSVN